MDTENLPGVFQKLASDGCVNASEMIHTQDGFWMIYKSLSDILAEKGILDFPGTDGTRLSCGKFFDDWFLYAVPGKEDYTCSLVKLREQEFDAMDSAPADSDTPGVTVSFIAFRSEVLFDCLAVPSDENRSRISSEINRVVACRGERHHSDLKRYFISPKSEGAYRIADLYTAHIAALSPNGYVAVPERFRSLAKKDRLPKFIGALSRAAGYTICDGEKIYIRNKDALTGYERAAILATHTGNTSERSFAAEVKLHARFLCAPARIKIPFLGRSAYDSAIRADMIVNDRELGILSRLMQGIL